ncbi:SDR family NAD(P)-dependent oxidoreductase, partial [Phenylobacterium sp.]|uniref:SDR family NAD(P)-dependent oxidoreductase n=1 Tax=Phenylobacterium sp. TaxID=1871053 RepID=UPI0037CBBBDD
MKLDSTVSAVVTGGASGLGKATVKALRDLGVKVAIFDFNPETGEAAAKELGALFCQVNVMDEDSVDAGFAKARAAHGQERILINCAGGGRGGKTVGKN